MGLLDDGILKHQKQKTKKCDVEVGVNKQIVGIQHWVTLFI